MRIGIIYFNMSLDKPCGSRVITVNLAKELAKRGHSVFILCNKGKNPKIPGVKIIEVDTPPYGSCLNCIKDPVSFADTIHKYTRALLQVVQKENIQIIHTQHCLYSTIIANNAKILLGVPFVSTCHGSETHEAEADPRMKKLLQVTREATEIIALSEYSAKQIARDYFNGMNISVAAPGVDFSLFKLRKNRKTILKRHNFSRDSSLAVFVGRLISEKGVLELLDCFSKVNNKLPKSRLVILGSGELKLAIKSKIAKLHLNNAIVFLGAHSQDQIAEYYSAADLVLVPSIWEEPFGLVALEGFASGAPVLANDVGGLGQIIRSIDKQLLVSPGKWKIFTAKMIKLLQKPVLNQSRHKYRNKVMTKYNWSKMTEKTIRVYKRAIEGNFN